MPTPTFTWGTPSYRDGVFSTAARVSLPVLSSPIPGVVTEYVLTERWQQYRRDFTPLAINTLHPEYKVANSWERDFFLVSEGPRQDMGGGVVQWDRTYAAVPAQHSEFEAFVYNFIGYCGTWGINVETATGRERFQRAVMSKVVHDYFKVDMTLGSDAAPIYKLPGNIPMNVEQQYYESGFATLSTDYLKDTPPFTTASSPSRTTYEGYVSDATTNKWAATTGLIVAETSKLSRWMGDIWLRTTRYVLAQ
jgi:hypothetical protein